MERQLSTSKLIEYHKPSVTRADTTNTPAPLNRRFVYFTIICSISCLDFNGQGSAFLAPYVTGFANASMIANYGSDFATPKSMRWVRSFTVSQRSFASLIGFLFLPLAMEKLGRRFTGMFAANVLLVLGGLLQMSCVWLNHFEFYMAGQFAQGFGASFTPSLFLLMGESAPDRYRG
jgi:MFS family permease